jgi:hypothetical protein
MFPRPRQSYSEAHAPASKVRDDFEFTAPGGNIPLQGRQVKVAAMFQPGDFRLRRFNP